MEIKEKIKYMAWNIYKLNRSYNKVAKNKREELEEKLRENQKNHSSQTLYYSIRQNYELNRIKNILGNDNGRPDLFYLSPDRWKTKKSNFKTPGPAYYYY